MRAIIMTQEASSNPPIKWVRPKRAKELVPCGLTKLYELIGDGRLVTKRVDGMRLVSVASIEALGE
jgi:hypothetical protein